MTFISLCSGQAWPWHHLLSELPSPAGKNENPGENANLESKKYGAISLLYDGFQWFSLFTLQALALPKVNIHLKMWWINLNLNLKNTKFSIFQLSLGPLVRLVGGVPGGQQFCVERLTMMWLGLFTTTPTTSWNNHKNTNTPCSLSWLEYKSECYWDCFLYQVYRSEESSKNIHQLH